jgi:hypothetical protein
MLRVRGHQLDDFMVARIASRRFFGAGDRIDERAASNPHESRSRP